MPEAERTTSKHRVIVTHSGPRDAPRLCSSERWISTFFDRTLHARLTLFLVVLACLLPGSRALAAPKPVAVGVFEGPFGEDVRQKTAQAIDKQGVLAVAKDKPADRVGINETKGTYEDVARKLLVAGILVGEVENKNDEWSVLLAVYAANGELLQKFRIRAPTADDLNAKVVQLVPKHLAKLLEEYEPPPKPKPKPPPPVVLAQPKAEPKPAPKAEPKPAPKAEPAPKEPQAQGDTEGAIAVQLEEEPAPAPAEDESSEAAEEDEPDEAAGPSGPLPSPFDLEVAFGYSSRNFAYKNSVTPNLDMSNAGLAWLTTLRVYPGALFDAGVVGNIGLELGLESGYPNNPEALGLAFRAQTSRFFIGPRARIPIGAHEVSLVGGYGAHAYRVIGDENLDEDGTPGAVDPCIFNTATGTTRSDIPPRGSCLVPDVVYKYLRFGADARFRLSKFLVGVRAGYRVLLGAGEIEEPYWFGGTSGGAFEAGVSGGYVLSDMLVGLVGFDYYGYSLSFEPAPPERAMGGPGPIADGAGDAYIQIWAGIGITLPGFN